MGGKRFLAKRIIERIEAIPHRCYAEPFVGMGGVFLRRGKRPGSEAINDINGEVVNLFRVVREHPDELIRQFDWVISARAEFERLLRTPPDTLTDVRRAARFAYMQRLRFGGQPSGAGMAFHAQVGKSVRSEQMLRLIRAAHRRLQRVQVDCLEWHAFIRRYDKPFTLFYIDPPYWGNETDYGKGLFSRDDFARMAEILRGLKGRFILSLNDRLEVRETFEGFRIDDVSTTYTANSRVAGRAAELLISNGGA